MLDLDVDVDVDVGLDLELEMGGGIGSVFCILYFVFRQRQRRSKRIHKMMTYCPTLAHSSHQAHHALLVLIRRYLNLPLYYAIIMQGPR